MNKIQTKVLEKALKAPRIVASGMDVRLWVSGLSSSVCKILLKDDRIWNVLTVLSIEDINRQFSRSGYKRAKGKFKKLIKGEAPTERTAWINIDDNDLLDAIRRIILCQPLPRGQKDMELSKFNKWGPQGGKTKLVDIIADILGYFDPIEYTVPKRVEEAAIQRVIIKIEDALLKGGVLPENMRVKWYTWQQSLMESIAKGNLNSSSGTRQNLPRKSKISIREAFHLVKKGIIGLANQVGTTLRKCKKRLYWSPSFAQNLDEGCMTIPLLDLMRYSHLACFQALDNLDFIGASLTNFWGDRELAAMFDFKKMDTKTGLDAVRVVSLILGRFSPEDGYDRLYASLKNSVEVPLMITETLMLDGPHGEGSGSRWTNFLEVMFNLYIVEVMKMHTFLPDYTSDRSLIKHDKMPLAYNPSENFKFVSYINGDDLMLILTSASKFNGRIDPNTKFFTLT